MSWSKKLLVVFLVLSMVAALSLSACGGGDSDNPEENAPSSPVSEATGQGQDDPAVNTEDVLGKSKGKGFTFETVMTAPGVEGLPTKNWVQGENWRSEMESPGGEGTMVSIFNASDGAMYMYHPQENMATKMDIGLAENEAPVEEYDPADLDYLGRETIDGKNCLVYQVNEGGDSSKVWIWEDHGFPVRMEGTIEGEAIVVEYKNIQLGDIPDSMFTLPDGVQVMQF